MRLSARLQEIVNFCGEPVNVADVGCDHGKVLLQLLKQGTSFAIASDISAKSVKKAKQLLERNNYSNFDVRVGDGLNTLNDNDKLDVIIISGIGGCEIIQILKKSTIALNKLVIQPQKNVEKLRIYLQKNGFYIIKDKVVQDGEKFYNVLLVKKTNVSKKLTKREIIYGKTNLITYNKSFIKMLEKENGKLKKRLDLITNCKLKEEMNNLILQNNLEIVKAEKRR